MRELLIKKAQSIIGSKDRSHDIGHAFRVLANAEKIAKIEGGDMEVIIPAALFHDAIVYPKDSLKSKSSAIDSAELTEKILIELDYPKEKIPKVCEAILCHSFSYGKKPSNTESKIIYDADKLEATGAVSIMRTFCSTGQMEREFYSRDDPFCARREPGFYALDLFYSRLLHVKDKMFTETGKMMASKRTDFLHDFLDQVKDEITINSPDPI